MRILSFALFCLFLLSSPVTAVYVTWGDQTSKKTELESNTNLVHCLEVLMEKQNSHFTNFDALPNRYILAIKKGNQYGSFRDNYNSTPKKSGSSYLGKLLRNSILNTHKNANDKTNLKEYAYTISHKTSGEAFHFYAIPRSQFYTLKLNQEAQFKIALANLIPGVAYFGSCRVRLPLYTVRDANKITIHNITVPNGQYTASEAVQTYKFSTGQLDLPEERFRHLLWQNPHLRPCPILDYSSADVFIVESCSLREFILDGYYLNNTEILKLFKKSLMVKGKATYPLMDYYKHLVAQAEVEAGFVDPYNPREISTLNPVKLFQNLPDDFLTDDELYILTNLQVNILTEEAFIQHMADFSEIAEGKPVIYVSHVNAKGTDGNHLYPRELIDRYIQKGANNLGQYYFRPGDLFIDYPQRDVLVSRIDIHHYKPEFMGTVGEAIFTLVQESLTQ